VRVFKYRGPNEFWVERSDTHRRRTTHRVTYHDSRCACSSFNERRRIPDPGPVAVLTVFAPCRPTMTTGVRNEYAPSVGEQSYFLGPRPPVTCKSMEKYKWITFSDFDIIERYFAGVMRTLFEQTFLHNPVSAG